MILRVRIIRPYISFQNVNFKDCLLPLWDQYNNFDDHYHKRGRFISKFNLFLLLLFDCELSFYLHNLWPTPNILAPLIVLHSLLSIFYCSVIKRLDQYDDFYLAFQSVISNLMDILGNYECIFPCKNNKWKWFGRAYNICDLTISCLSHASSDLNTSWCYNSPSFQ